MQFLRTNTATRITVGPFLDKTDGVTPETALTVTSCKLTMMVDDAGVPTLVLDTNPTASGGANDMVHVTGDDAGYYDLELAAANVNYLGRAKLALTDAATHCPVFMEFMILPAVVYDSFVLGTDVFQVDVTQWLGTAAATPTVAGVPEVDITHAGGTAITVASGIPEVKVASLANNAITAASIAADAITDAKVASDVTIASVTGAVGSVTGAVGSVTGAVGSVTGNVGGNVVGSVASVVGAVGSVTGAVGSVTGAVGSVTGNVGGNVVGSVASVTGNVGGNVVGSVASVTAKVTPIDIDGITFANMMKYIGATTQGKCVVTFISGNDYTFDYYGMDDITIVWTGTCTLGGRASITRS